MEIEQRSVGIANGWADEVRELFRRIRRDMDEAGADGRRVRTRAVVRTYECPGGAAASCGARAGAGVC
ncbi:MAG: hypothetical protein ABI593_11295 [Betaproteobacteria bacterium]